MSATVRTICWLLQQAETLVAEVEAIHKILVSRTNPSQVGASDTSVLRPEPWMLSFTIWFCNSP